MQACRAAGGFLKRVCCGSGGTQRGDSVLDVCE